MAVGDVRSAGMEPAVFGTPRLDCRLEDLA